jgi:hypothetical protein
VPAVPPLSVQIFAVLAEIDQDNPAGSDPDEAAQEQLLSAPLPTFAVKSKV